jgi:hypothetical protein
MGDSQVLFERVVGVVNKDYQCHSWRTLGENGRFHVVNITVDPGTHCCAPTCLRLAHNYFSRENNPWLASQGGLLPVVHR